MVSLCKLSYGCNWQLAKHLISLNFTQQDVTLRYLLRFITSCLYWQLETCSINMKQLSKSTRLSSDLAACCCFSTPLKSNKHDDILFSLCWIPSLHTRVNKLCTEKKIQMIKHSAVWLNHIIGELRKDQICFHIPCTVPGTQHVESSFSCLIHLPYHQSQWQICGQ